MKLVPLDDKIVVKPDEAAKKSEGGILLPDQAQEKPHLGTVLAAGPGRLKDDGSRLPMDVKKGDRVLFGKWAGTDHEDLKIMRIDDILAKVE